MTVIAIASRGKVLWTLCRRDLTRVLPYTVCTVATLFDRPQPAAAKALGISLTSMKLVRIKPMNPCRAYCMILHSRQRAKVRFRQREHPGWVTGSLVTNQLKGLRSPLLFSATDISAHAGARNRALYTRRCAGS